MLGASEVLWKSSRKMNEEFLICEHCVSKNELHDELVTRGLPVGQCKICKNLGGKALPTSDPKIRRIFRALVRLNFSELQYNEHFSDDSLEHLVLRSKQIFDLNSSASIIDFEEAFLVMERGWYPSNEDEITLGGGYWNGNMLHGLRNRRDQEVERIVAECFARNYFEVLPQAKALIENLNNDICSTIHVGAEYLRGRVGVKASYTPDELYLGRIPRYYSPYVDSEIDRPPIARATEGRLNRPRVSVLYLASDVETAISELRPHPGHLVSTARFRVKKDISVANLARHDIRDFLSDGRLEVLRTILSISDVLNLPVQPEQKELYTVTQMFGDAVREAGFDAVSFRSSLAGGINLTCFAQDAFEIVSGSEQVHEIASLSYSIVAAPQIPKKYNEGDFTEIKGDPLSTIIYSMTRPFPEKN
jgi:hypothetical protein